MAAPLSGFNPRDYFLNNQKTLKPHIQNFQASCETAQAQFNKMARNTQDACGFDPRTFQFDAKIANPLNIADADQKKARTIELAKDYRHFLINQFVSHLKGIKLINPADEKVVQDYLTTKATRYINEKDSTKIATAKLTSFCDKIRKEQFKTLIDKQNKLANPAPAAPVGASPKIAGLAAIVNLPGVGSPAKPAAQASPAAAAKPAVQPHVPNQVHAAPAAAPATPDPAAGPKTKSPAFLAMAAQLEAARAADAAAKVAGAPAPAVANPPVAPQQAAPAPAAINKAAPPPPPPPRAPQSPAPAAPKTPAPAAPKTPAPAAPKPVAMPAPAAPTPAPAAPKPVAVPVPAPVPPQKAAAAPVLVAAPVVVPVALPVVQAAPAPAPVVAPAAQPLVQAAPAPAAQPQAQVAGQAPAPAPVVNAAAPQAPAQAAKPAAQAPKPADVKKAPEKKAEAKSKGFAYYIKLPFVSFISAVSRFFNWLFGKK